MTPHHLCLTDEAVRTLDPNVKMNPPLRTELDRGALLDALRDGTISAIATDHAPHSREEKEVPFEAAPFGVIGLETAFSALYTNLVLPGLLVARDAARAALGGACRDLRPRPRRASPSARRANLTLIDTEASWTVQPLQFRSRSINSWLIGERLLGRIRLTIADGRTAYEL